MGGSAPHRARPTRPSRFGRWPCCILLGLAAVAPASAADDVRVSWPDLAPTPPVDIRTSVEPVGSAGPRLLLRFSSRIRNIGTGAVEFVGRRPAGPEGLGARHMSSVVQTRFDAAGKAIGVQPSRARIIFENSDRHRHWHLSEAATLTLVRSGDLTPVASASKLGFCLQDSEARFPPPSAQRYVGCAGVDRLGRAVPRGLSPAAVAVRMGIQPGWTDIYDANLPFQWVDLTDVVAPGAYRLRNVVDPANVVVESDERTPPAYSRPIVLRGWRATTARLTSSGRARRTAIALGGRRIVGRGLPAGDALRGPPSAPRFALDAGPRHGTVQIDAHSGRAVYTPRANSCAGDSFQYTVRETGSMLAAPPATVVLTFCAGG